MVLLLAERRVGEVDVVRFADRDPLGALSFLPSHWSASTSICPFFIGARDAARARLAGVQAALRIEGVAAGAMRIGAENLGVVTGDPFEQAIARDVAEDQISPSFDQAGPSRKHEILRGELEFDCWRNPARKRTPATNRLARTAPGAQCRRIICCFFEVDVVDHLLDALHLLGELRGAILLLGFSTCR